MLSVENHLKNVAAIARTFAENFNPGETSYSIGLLHDIGKYSNKFQNRILYNGEKVDHSTAGGQEIARITDAWLAKNMEMCYYEKSNTKFLAAKMIHLKSLKS